MRSSALGTAGTNPSLGVLSLSMEIRFLVEIVDTRGFVVFHSKSVFATLLALGVVLSSGSFDFE